MSTIGITGGTGFVGRNLVRLLREDGNKVVVFTRRPEKMSQTEGVTYCYWDPAEKKCDLTCLKELDAMVHLAGTNIGKRWIAKRKEAIVNSRVAGTDFLVSQLQQYAPNCKTFVSASAVGYYGPDRTGKPFKEGDIAYNDFIGSTCRKWEQEAQKAAPTMRTVILRFGLVIGRGGGVFKEFDKMLSLGVMPVMGSGRQMMSWIHILDLTNLIYYAIRQNSMEGIYNAVAPNPTTQKELVETMARERGGKMMPFRIPAFALKLFLGEMSTELLKSSTVSADKLRATGFDHTCPDIQTAIRRLMVRTALLPVAA